MKHIVSALSFALALSAAPVLAQQATVDPAQDERARVHYAAGEDFFRRGDYETALREFTVSHEASGRPELLFNIGSCHERLAHYAEAASYFERYLNEAAAPNDPEVLRDRIANLRARTAVVEPVATEPEPVVALPSVPEPIVVAEPAVTPSGGGIHPASLALIGIGAAGLVSFAVMGSLALDEDSALTTECGTACPSDRVSTLNTLSLGADISLGVGAGLGIVGIILAVALPAESETRVDVQTSSTGASVLVSQTF
jgi:hypothetical protein